MSGGLVVALVGMDGAGKTSAIERNKSFCQAMNIAKYPLVVVGAALVPWE